MNILIALIIGLVLGFSLAQLLHLSTKKEVNKSTSIYNNRDESRHLSNSYDEYSNEQKIDQYSSFSGYYNKLTRSHITVNRSMADRLYNETRVLCWVMTSPKNHASKAFHVKNTWGSRCNKLLLMSSEEDKDLGVIKLPVREGRKYLWNKTREAFKYIYDHHLDDADWFLKADDDTYVIAENLRAFLYPFSTEAPVYFGCKFKPLVRQGYMSGGAGYVLSKEAVRRFVERAYTNKSICRQNIGGSEDKEMGYCLQNVRVVAGDSRDSQKRGRFFPSNPQGHIIPKDKSHWYWRYIYYATEDGLNCCSDHAVSFHYIRPDFFYLLDYLVYHLKAFGIANEPDILPEKFDMNTLLEKWRNETSDNLL